MILDLKDTTLNIEEVIVTLESLTALAKVSETVDDFRASIKIVCQELAKTIGERFIEESKGVPMGHGATTADLKRFRISPAPFDNSASFTSDFELPVLTTVAGYFGAPS